MIRFLISCLGYVCHHALSYQKLQQFTFFSFLIAYTETIVSVARYSLVSIIAIYVIYGCPMWNHRIIVKIVDFVEWVVVKIFVIVLIVACASIHYYLMITIANPANI
jgi:hypothetical protein